VKRNNEDPQIFEVTYTGNHACVPGPRLLPLPEQQRSSGNLLSFLASGTSSGPSGSISTGSSSITNAETEEIQITYNTPTWDDHQVNYAATSVTAWPQFRQTYLTPTLFAFIFGNMQLISFDA
jgi:hypothetical protein